MWQGVSVGMGGGKEKVLRGEDDQGAWRLCVRVCVLCEEA
jgi:hypothetical protein